MIEELKILLDLLLAIILGFVIGFERKMRFKEAGIRTHTIVCVGSALMMVVSLYAFGEGADQARVAAQIVSGIGFLGAGMIVYRKHEVHGLTTAAGVWATAGVGMACGGGLYIVAVGATAILVFVQCIFHLKWGIFHSKKIYLIEIEFLQTESENLIVKDIFSTDRFNQLVIKRDEGGQVYYSAILNTAKELSSTQINEIMKENSFIRSIKRWDSN